MKEPPELMSIEKCESASVSETFTANFSRISLSVAASVVGCISLVNRIYMHSMQIDSTTFATDEPLCKPGQNWSIMREGCHIIVLFIIGLRIPRSFAAALFVFHFTV
jgi:hypothetical protein